MASARALGDVRRVVDAARCALAVPASRSLSTWGQPARIGCGNLSHRRRSGVLAAVRRAPSALRWRWRSRPMRRCSPGLLDITGGPFNPFIVMYAVYIWVGAVAISPVWATVVSVASAVRLRLARGRSPAGRIARAPSTERLSDASLHDVVLRRWDCGARRALHRARTDGARATTGATRRSAGAGGTERAVGVVDDARGGRRPRAVDAARDHRGGRR